MQLTLTVTATPSELYPYHWSVAVIRDSDTRLSDGKLVTSPRHVYIDRGAATTRRDALLSSRNTLLMHMDALCPPR